MGKRNKLLKNRLKFIIPAAAAVVIAAAALELTNTIDLINKTTPPASDTQPISQPSPDIKDEAPKSTSPTGTSGNQNLLAPNQSTHVSNHEPSSSNSSLQSVCVTSPGVTCTMVFAKGSISRSLPNKVTDSSGAAYWTWTPSQLGLSSGSWYVTAKATLGSQTKTAKDIIPLRVP